jgi:DNA-binding response OmpR family regulator
MTKYKILYAEDDATIAFLTQDHLEQNNYDVIHCDDGEKAFQEFKNQVFDICIFDIMMPKMDGFELAEKIRQLNTEIPIIFLSAKTLKEDRIKGLKLDYNGIFPCLRFGVSTTLFSSILKALIIFYGYLLVKLPHQ